MSNGYAAFFYGTLMAPEVLYRVIFGITKPEHWLKELVTIKPALLRGYQRRRIFHRSYPAITPCEGATVRGTLVTGLTRQNIRQLDIFEAEEYRREKVQVEILDDVKLDEGAEESYTKKDDRETFEAETYVWGSDMEELEKREWDFEEFKNEKMRRFLGEEDIVAADDTGVDEGFADVDRAVAEKGQDETGGRGANGYIMKKLEEAAV